MMAGGSEEAEARENGETASVACKAVVPFAALGVPMGEGVGRGEEAAVVMGRSMTAQLCGVVRWG